jgi:hypothetical protein
MMFSATGVKVSQLVYCGTSEHQHKFLKTGHGDCRGPTTG